MSPDSWGGQTGTTPLRVVLLSPCPPGNLFLHEKKKGCEMAAAITDPELRAGVRPVDGWRFVQEAAPDLIATWQAAQADFDRSEPAWQQKCARHQRDIGMPRRHVPSPESKALQEAEAAVAARLEELIREGAIIYAGFRSGALGDNPTPIPLAVLGDRRPRGSKFTARGITFHDVKLYPAAAEPEPVTDPPPTTDRLVEALAELFFEDSAWETLGPAKLAPIVAQRDRRFRPGNGVWAPATLVEKIKVFKQQAKAEARARRA